MARPERKTVDYFPHYISDGKKMFFIEHKYGNDGYAVWFKVLEMIASTEDHFLNLSDDTDMMFLSAKCKVSEAVLSGILDDLSKLGEIDKNMWANKVVWSQKFIDSVQDAYTRRNNKCMDFDSLCNQLLRLRVLKTDFRPKNKDNNTQSIVKESKEDKTKLMLWLEDNCPRVCKMPNPITVSQSKTIAKKYPNARDVVGVFESMENFKDLHKKYVSAYSTFNNWATRRAKENPNWGQLEPINTPKSNGYL